MTTWNLQGMECHLLICNGGSCLKRQADEVTLALRQEIALLGVDEQMHTTRTRCNGRCADACVVIAYPEGIWYKDITPELARSLVRKHAVGDRLEDHIVYSYHHQLVATGDAAVGQSKKRTDTSVVTEG